jgi:hypothetical protein
MKLPLLLYMASVFEPRSYSRAAAETLLGIKAKDRRVKAWPVPIALWLLEQITQAELRKRCEDHNEVETRVHHWLADFYFGVHLCAAGEQQQFKDAMHKVSDTSRPEWSEEDLFLARIWSEEFFIARRTANGSRSLPFSLA